MTLFHAREKAGKSTFLSAAVAAVTQGRAFLGVPLAAGDVLWVGEEAAADVKGRLTRDGADLDRVLFIRSPSPDQQEEGSLPQLVDRFRPRWLVIDTWTHYLTSVQRTGGSAGPVEQARRLGEVVDLRDDGAALTTIRNRGYHLAPQSEARAPWGRAGRVSWVGCDWRGGGHAGVAHAWPHRANATPYPVRALAAAGCDHQVVA